MNHTKTFLKYILIMLSTMAFTACSGETWKEEALQADGSVIIVERTVDRGGRHEIGQKPPIKNQSFGFTVPKTKQTVKWEDNFTEDIGGSNFLPMMMNVHKDVPYVVAYPMGCTSYNKWGRPNPPYVVFKYENKQWNRIDLQELPEELKTPNLIFSMPDIEAKNTGKSIVSAKEINAIYAGYRQPEYRSILRVPLPVTRMLESCALRYGNGKGHWLSEDWFKDSKSLKACQEVCKTKDFMGDTCPCAKLFKE